MDDEEFIKQRIFWQKRLSQAIVLRIAQEGRSKKSITESEKSFFIEEVRRQLSEQSFHGFRAPIIFKINFRVRNDNHPYLRTLVKCYLDLLNGTLFKDDSQISILVARLEYAPKEESEISCYAYRLSSYLTDLKTYIHEVEELEPASGRDSDYEFALQQLDDAPPELQDFFLKEAQRKLLSENHVSAKKLYALLANMDNRDSSLFEAIQDGVYKWTASFTNLDYIEQKPNGSFNFKETLQNKLAELKNRYPFMSPLKINFGINILFREPLNNQPDLDNIARIVNPKIEEVFNMDLKEAKILSYQIIKVHNKPENQPYGHIAVGFSNEFTYYRDVIYEVQRALEDYFYNT